MAFDIGCIYSRTDILRILRTEYYSTQKTLSMVEPTDVSEAYRQGFNTALESVALAIGIVPVSQPNTDFICWKDA